MVTKSILGGGGIEIGRNKRLISLKFVIKALALFSVYPHIKVTGLCLSVFTQEPL